MPVDHVAALCNEDPGDPDNALELIVDDVTELLWVRAVNPNAEVAWLHLRQARLADTADVEPKVPSMMLATGPNLIPLGVEFSSAISALVSTDRDGTGTPSLPVFVQIAHAPPE